MWLTTERTEPGPVFGNKGLTLPSTLNHYQCSDLFVADQFTGLGILLDT